MEQAEDGFQGTERRTNTIFITMNTDHIAILMGTYNGERYIREQLDSLLRQTCRQWTLYIHDDGSTDATNSIIEEYAAKDSRIQILKYPSQKGAMNNFFSMLEKVEADYYMFCDQDDVWKDEKVAMSLQQLVQTERQHPGLPVIVYTDLHVTDEHLTITYNSFWQEICLHPEFITNFDEVAACTAVTGCAMLFNPKAKEAALRFPKTYATMHDAWITVCTLQAGGKIVPIPQQMVFYRQHGNNQIGADDLNHITLMYRIKNFKVMQRKNWRQYRMMHSIGYGSILKFFYYKWVYKKRIHRKQRAQ